MTIEFDSGIKQFFAAIEDSLESKIDTSQIWSLDSQGFHLIYKSGDAKQDHCELARQACIKNQPIFDRSVCAYPFKLNARQSGALIIDYAEVWDEALKQDIQIQIKQQFAPLAKLLSAERFARLSGSAQRADWLGKAISLAYQLEYEQDSQPIYLQIHHALKQLMYARNLFIVKRDPNEDFLTFEYLCDQYDDNADPIVIHEGVLQGSLSAYVVRSGRVIRGSTVELAKEMGYGGGPAYGQDAYDWLGVPLALGQQVLGAIVVQSYDQNIQFNDTDPNLLAVLAEALASTFQRKQIRQQLQQQVAQRTEQLAQMVSSLEQAIATQKDLQDQLVESQKQVALGRLVTGVAHELNTPLGICVTASSVIDEQIKKSADKFATGNLKKTDLIQLFGSLTDSSALLCTNLTRADQLIERFKQVATQQQTMDIHRFNVSETVQSVIQQYQCNPLYANFRFHLKCQAPIEANSCPQALRQIIEQLIDNSLTHGFAEQAEGDITITIHLQDQQVLIDYKDNGIGMDPTTKAKAFDPFFTTNRSHGSVGIGLHIVSNLVNQTLKGSICLGDKQTTGIKVSIGFAVDVAGMF